MLFAGVMNTATDTDGFQPQFATNSTPLVDVSGSLEGADDEGATTVISLAIVGGDNTDSLLHLTGSAQDILLVQEGDLIVGRLDSDGDGVVNDGNPLDLAVFAISIDQDGEASIALYASLDHPIAPNDFDDTLDLDGLVDAVVTVTDGDGDVDVDEFGIGDKLKFDDDGPLADIADGFGMVTVDETDGLDDDDTLDAGVAMLFAGVMNTATDTDGFQPQFATNSTPLVDVSGSLEGADDEGATTVISLAIVGGDNTDSLLHLTGSAQDILLVQEGDLIVGRLDSDGDGVVNDGNPLDLAVFAISIDQDGEASIALYASLDHPIAPNDFDDTLDLDGLVDAVVTVTDGDGDVDVDEFGIGDKLKFDDDGPTLTVPPNSLVKFITSDGSIDAGGLDGNEIKVINFDPGADDEGASLVLTDFTDPDDGLDLAASGLDLLETLLGEDIVILSSNSTSVTYGFNDGISDFELFRLILDTTDPEGYTFEVLQDAPIVTFDLDISALEPGSPTEDETFTGVTGGGLDVLFDGLYWGSGNGANPADLTDSLANLGLGDPDDDINTNQQGFGIKNDQASQVNNQEGFFASFGDIGPPPEPIAGPSDNIIGFKFDIEGIGNIATTGDDKLIINFLVLDGGEFPTTEVFWRVVDEDDETIILASGHGFITDTGGLEAKFGLPGGNNEVTFIVETADGFDQIFVQVITPDGQDSSDPKDWNDGVRFNEFQTIEQTPIPPLTLSFEVQGTDGDGDTTQFESFDVFITDDGMMI